MPSALLTIVSIFIKRFIHAGLELSYSEKRREKKHHFCSHYTSTKFSQKICDISENNKKSLHITIIHKRQRELLATGYIYH
jgi:Zn-dependent oligopeptidase